jgi:hypothetical protein
VRTSTIGGVRAIAALFGASSPTTTCSVVMSANESADAIPMPAICAASPSSGSSAAWNAGSPTAPRPREQIVIPSWHADR